MAEVIWQRRFKKVKKLADTLQGHIFLAIDLKNDNTNVVIKQTFIKLVEEGKSRDGHVVHEDFLNEVALLTLLSRQPDADIGFARILVNWETEDCYFYAMEWCEAELFKHISNAFAPTGPMHDLMKRESTKQQVALDSNDSHLWLSQIRSIFKQCVKAVYWMHNKGVCHLDLSLENTMIWKVDGLKVKVIDFGLGKFYDYKNDSKAALFLNDQRVGKRGYMAPEVYNKMVYDARKADVWSLGVMLFMMLVGAPPYKRATKRDAAFNYIINGMLSDVLKHWKRLRLVSKDALDCMEKILKWEKERMSMEQLVCHPFVGLEHLLKRNAADFEHSYARIKSAMKAYHDEYALLMQAQADNKENVSKSEDNGNENESLISFKTDALSQSEKFILPQFESACKPILDQGNVRLLEDFNFILTKHAQSNRLRDALSGNVIVETEESENEKEFVQSMDQINEELLNEIKNKQFLQIANSIIIRRCFRDRKKCEDESGLLKVYGKYNKSVIGDDEHRMAMQIMDKIYCYFAYSHLFGYEFTEDEIKQVTQSEDAMSQIKAILKRKKQRLMSTNHQKKIYQVIKNRKVKFCTSSKHQYSDKYDEQKKEASKDVNSLSVFDKIKEKMQKHLDKLSTPQTMNAKEFIKFIKTLQPRSKKEQKLESIKSISSEHWKALVAKFESGQYSQSDFQSMERKTFGKILKGTIPAGALLKVYKVLTDELNEIDNERCFTSKKELSKLSNSECVKLIQHTLKEESGIDVENEFNLEQMEKLLADDKIDGMAMINLSDECIFDKYVKPCLNERYGDICAHSYGKRYRYWPAYSDNKSTDLLNGKAFKDWYAKPKFNDIKEEILNNIICHITVNQWNRTVLYASKIVSKMSFFKNLRAVVPANKKKGGATQNSAYNKYGVRDGDKIRLEHLVPLLIYINLDFVSKALLNSYNNHNALPNDYKKSMRYHSQLSHLARLLRETVECYGKKFDENSPTLYHLADTKIIPSSLNLRFLSPCSVTSSLNAALIFNDFEPNEVVLELKCAQNSNLRYFDCSFLSDFPNEHEYLICGGLGCLKIANVFDLSVAQNYIYHIKAIEMLMNAVKNEKIQSYEDESIKKIGISLNEMMQKRVQSIRSGDDEKENDKNENAFIDDMFASICDKLQFVEINMNDLLSSLLMKSVFCNNKWSNISFDVLSMIFPNVCGYFIDLRECENEKQIVFNPKLVKLMKKLNDDKNYKCAIVQNIQFFGVDKDIESCQEFKEYATQFDAIGWDLRTFELNESMVLSLDCKMNK